MIRLQLVRPDGTVLTESLRVTPIAGEHEEKVIGTDYQTGRWEARVRVEVAQPDSSAGPSLREASIEDILAELQSRYDSLNEVDW